MTWTRQRRLIVQVLSEARDHPDIPELHRRVGKHDPRISEGTIYRTVKLLESKGILESHSFRNGRTRYEKAPEKHHDHLIDLDTGEIVEFRNEEIERLQHRVAERLGYRILTHHLELYGWPLAKDDGSTGRGQRIGLGSRRSSRRRKNSQRNVARSPGH